MPSAEEISCANPSAKTTTTTTTYLLGRQEVDVLVSRIKENLRLTSQLKSRSSLKSASQQHRPSPYRLPGCSGLKMASQKRVLEDSYERFQALLRKGSLIKEAVKRLREEDDEPEPLDVEEHYALVDSMDDDSSNDDFLYRRKPFYYDSEDEPI